MANYLVIQKNDESIAYAFKVKLEGYRPEVEKVQRDQYTVTGKLDVQSGPVQKNWIYTIKLYETDTGSFSISGGSIMTAVSATWGDLSILRALFDVNTPPANKYRFRDFDGNEYYMFFWGKMLVKPLTSLVTGADAYLEVSVLMKGSPS